MVKVGPECEATSRRPPEAQMPLQLASLQTATGHERADSRPCTSGSTRELGDTYSTRSGSRNLRYVSRMPTRPSHHLTGFLPGCMLASEFQRKHVNR